MTVDRTTPATLPVDHPDAVGLSGERLRRIIPVLNAEVEAGRMPGAVIAIARHGRLVFHEAVGFLGPDRRVPMPRDALFAIASMTKPVTGVAGLMLWEEGRLGLGDPVERFLPELGNRRVAVLDERGGRIGSLVVTVVAQGVLRALPA